MMGSDRHYLLSLLSRLYQHRSNGVETIAIRVPKYKTPVHLAMQPDNPAPVLLIEEPKTLRKGHRLDLRSIRIEPSIRCRIALIDDEKGEDEGQYTVIQLKSKEPEIVRYHLRIIEAILDHWDNSGNPSISTVVQEIAEILSKTSTPSAAVVLGLWGELFLIYSAKDPSAMLDVWRKEESSVWDFSFEYLRIESKITTKQRRLHTFSLHQLEPPKEVELYVASLMTHQVSKGLSISLMCDHLLEAGNLSPSQQDELELKVLTTLGTNWEHAMHAQFDEQAARDSLRLFASDRVPRVVVPDRERILDVSFVVDLTGCESVSVANSPFYSMF